MSLLAAAYAVQSAVPRFQPTAASALSFHLTSCVWYGLYETKSSQRWLRGVGGFRLAALPPSTGVRALFVLGSALQYPVYAPCATPFTLCAVLGLERAVGSNVVMLFMAVCLGLSVAFEPSLLLLLATTAVSLVSFGSTAHRADAAAHRAAAAAHALFAAVALVAVMRSDGVRPVAEPLCSALVAVFCAEARLSASESAGSPTRAVGVACQAAAVGSLLLALPMRFARELAHGGSHTATAALAAVALCAPWFWGFHRAWDAARPHPDVITLHPLGISLTLILLVSFVAAHYISAVRA